MGSYKSRRNNNQEEIDNNLVSTTSNNNQQKNNSSKNLIKQAAKTAATRYGGKLGGKAVDMLSKTKLGDKMLNKGSEALNKVPGLANTLKPLNNNLINKENQINNNIKNDKQLNKSDKSSNSTGEEKAGGNSKKLGGASSSLLGKKKNGLLDGLFGKDKEKQSSLSNITGIMKIPIIAKIGIIAAVPFILFLLLIIVILSPIIGTVSAFNDAIGISYETGFTTGGLDYAEENEDAKNFYKRVKAVKEEYEKQNINVDPLKVVAVFYVLDNYSSQVDYNYMTKSRIEEITTAMLESGESGTYYSESKFKDELTNNIFKKYFPNKSDKDRQKYTEEVFEYIENYYDLVDYKTSISCPTIGTCSYDIKGFYISGGKGNISKNINVNNLKVRLMQTGTANGHDYGGTFGLPLDGEELVDFEKYILGVAYAEMNPNPLNEAFKAQLVAARSYILARPTEMGGWRTLKQEGDGWVLQTAASTQDQVYCDPDKGCSTNHPQWQQVYSGTNISGIKKHKDPLPSDSTYRTLANETMGEVLVNSQGYIIYSEFVSKEQDKFEELAAKGLNYKEILLQVYNSSDRPYGASDIVKMNCNKSDGTCSQAVLGDYASWKQNQGPWIGIHLGKSSKTIASDGCLVTSVAMQIARSGVATNIAGEFNPGSFVEFLNAHNSFDGAAFIWAGATLAAPSFKYNGKTSVTGLSKEQKYNELVKLLNQGYYVLAEVKQGNNSGQHWVAIVSAQNGDVTMMDPASKYTSLWEKYDYEGISTYSTYRVG